MLNTGVERLAHRLGVRPAGQRLGHGVHVGDAALDVGRDDRIPDAGERRPQPLLLVGISPLGDLHGLTEPSDSDAHGDVHGKADQVWAGCYEERKTRRYKQEDGERATECSCQQSRSKSADPRSEGDGNKKCGVGYAVAEKWIEQPTCDRRQQYGSDRKDVSGRKILHHHYSMPLIISSPLAFCMSS